MQYQITSSGMPTSSFSFPFNTNNYANYTTHSLTASNTGVEGVCTSSVNIQVAVCDIEKTSAFRSSVQTAPVVYNVSSWFTTGSQNATGNMYLTVVNNTANTSIYNGLLSAATAISFAGSLTDSFSISVRDIAIPLTCTYNYPIAGGLCGVLVQEPSFYRQLRWDIGGYVGTQGPTMLYGTPDVNNYGLARFFNNENPDNLSYRVRVYNYDGTQLPPVTLTPGGQGSGTFYDPGFTGTPAFSYEWRYKPTAPWQEPGLPNITGNVALFKISYSTTYLATAPSLNAPDGGFIANYEAASFFMEIVALENPPDCTPTVSLKPPLAPDPDPFDGLEVCCFTGDTLVTLADLTTKRIDQVRVGDKVLSYNEITGEQVISTVQATTSPIKNNIVKFTLSNGTVVEATTEHPLWEVNKGWCSYSPPATLRDHKMKVAKIEEGDILLTQEGIQVQIVSMELGISREYEQVYNIKLEGHYTYYANGIVVHNEKPANEQVTCIYSDDFNPDPYNPIP
jgi:hypothetical protein